MRIVQINATCGKGSTGNICLQISKLSAKKGDENHIFYVSGASDYPLGKSYMTRHEIKMAALASRLFGDWGFHSEKATQKLLRHLDEISPDIVHLHNLHGHNCQLETLLSYLKEKQCKVIWTFHDCWAFTGYCMHFDMVGCEKWKTGCQTCPQKANYSWLWDKSTKLFKKKRELLTGLDLTVVTPSRWLAGCVKQSFLAGFPVRVIPNGIDLSVFHRSESEFKRQYEIGNSHMVLGVSFDWGNRKGLDVMIELSKRLGKDYRVVLVGTNPEIDRLLPESILSIHRTESQSHLAQIYSAADVFVNPTREENFPTVNMEALACGTPVVTFATGGSAEMLDDTCGISVPKNDVNALHKAIERVCEQKPFSAAACEQKAKDFDQTRRFEEYMTLYQEVTA